MQSRLAEQIYQAALACGFDDCGIISPDALEGFDPLLQERKEKISSGGFYKFMGGSAQTKERFPWAKAIVVCSYWYGKYRYPAALQGHYAKDYFLKPEAHVRQGYDLPAFEARMEEMGIRFAGGSQFGHGSVAPLRYAAVKAGLGIFRKNNFFYTENGSHNRLIGYVIDQACELIHECSLSPCSESCTRCLDACKTKALCAPFTLEPMNCVSYWTTFGKGVVPPHLETAQFEEWICGCDNCQDACPYNRRHDWRVGEAFADLEELAEALSPEHLLAQTDDFLIEHVIAKSDDHLRPTDAEVLRRNAARALQYRATRKDGML